MSIAPRSPAYSPTRKRIVQAIGSPLRIQIPQWSPPSTIPEPTPALASGSESESEGRNSPTTPRVVSPQNPAMVVALSSSPPTSDDVDSLPLGSLSLSDRQKSRGRALSSSRPSLGPVVFTKPLAKGSCGRPYVAWDRATGSVICTKVFFKSSVRSSPHKELLRVMLAELRAYKRIATADESARSWLMEVHGVVQDMTRILFVMDVMHADLFAVLEEAYIHNSHGIPEDISKRWIAQLALGIDSLHNMGIMHRDLKPENVLISLGPGLELEGSHLRITDFGHAWQAPGDSLDKQMLGLSQKAEPGQPLHWQRVYSNRWIGTLEYMAPEVHRREAYGPMVDWWTLGHLAYDIFTGQSLLPDERALHYFLKWQANPPDKRPYVEYRGPSWLSPEQVHLITRLMAVTPTDRLRLPQLQEHPFFLSDDHSVFDEFRGVIPFNRPPEKKSGASIVHATACDEPVAYIRAKLPEARGECGDDAIRELLKPLSWINPHGLWANASEDSDSDVPPTVRLTARKPTRSRHGTL